MEIHKSIKLDNRYKLSLTDNYIDYFTKALEFTTEYYKEDLDRISSTKFENITPDFFLREMAWCICVSGFNAKVVSKFFPKLLEILDPMFSDIANGKWQYWDDCRYTLDKPLAGVFRNKRKMDAIIYNSIELVSRGIKKKSWELYRDSELDSPDKLEKFQMIGPAISKHLARNIGLLNFVKPDVHLKRFALNWKFKDPDELCLAIQKEFNLPLGLIDLVLWYGASTFGTKI